MSLGIFDQKFGWWWEHSDGATIEMANGGLITVGFYYNVDDSRIAARLGYTDAAEAADVDFCVQGDNSYDTMTRYGRVGTLVNTVGVIIGRWVQRREPPLLTFHAAGKRARIYEAMARKAVLPGYQLYRLGDPTSVYGADYALLRQPVPNREALRTSGAVAL